MEAALSALPLYEHLGLIFPFNKSGTFNLDGGTKIVRYAPTQLQLVSKSGEGHDMVDSKFSYACGDDGQWKPIDPRRMNEYRFVAVRSGKKLFVIDIKEDKVLIVSLEEKKPR